MGKHDQWLEYSVAREVPLPSVLNFYQHCQCRGHWCVRSYYNQYKQLTRQVAFVAVSADFVINASLQKLAELIRVQPAFWQVALWQVPSLPPLRGSTTLQLISYNISSFDKLLRDAVQHANNQAYYAI